MAFELVQSPSPNFNVRPDGAVVDTVIIHYTGMRTANEALTRMCDAASEVSAHYMIEQSGACHQLVAPENRAWHAGVSRWRGRDNLNHTSIGIELVNPGHEFGYQSFPDVQISNLIHLLESLEYLNIPRANYIGHSDVAPTRKADPGELFPWATLAKHGFGIVSNIRGDSTQRLLSVGDKGADVAALKQQLRTIGYSVPEGDIYCDETRLVIEALQRHWRQSTINGVLDVGTQAIVMDLVRIFEA